MIFLLIEQIINFENGEEININKIKAEISNITKPPEKFKIDNIRILLVGKA